MSTTIVSIKSTHVNPYPLEAVGEARYKTTLLKICGDYDTAEGYDDDSHAAELFLDNDNPHDPGNAVLVKIDELPVGYLSKLDARAYRQRLQKLGLSGDVIAISTASIRGGFEKDGEIADFSVRLDFFVSTFDLESNQQVAAIAPKVETFPPVAETPLSNLLRRLMPTPWHLLLYFVIIWMIVGFLQSLMK